VNHTNVLKSQAAILITLGVSFHDSTISNIVWEELPFHLGHYLFSLGFLQLLKVREIRRDNMQVWCSIQAFLLIWISIWMFEPAQKILQDLEIPPSNFTYSIWGWKSWGYCLFFFGSIQLMKISGAENPKLSLPQALLLIFWGIGFFEWGTFVWEYLPPFEFYNYLLALGIMEFLKTLDMANDSFPIRNKKRSSSLDNVYSRRRMSSHSLQKPSKTVTNKRTAPMFAPKKEMTTIECPGCKARMNVSKLGRMQNVTCKKCGLSGEIEI